ncbi:hypothetical protein [Cellulomonas telluris]|uniref:hypothetical protein n=1 Tax=Cellulomonas telluris TaxID=2306636 RepID=UPI0010A88156|nr:hypothetical protein [Cellulomonas telluris]
MTPAPTLVEFLQPLKAGQQRDKCLAVLYYYHAYKSVDAMTVGDIRNALVSARLPNAKSMNVAQVMADAGALVDASDLDQKGRRRWHLTMTGIAAVRDRLNLPVEVPEIAHDVSQLRKHAAGIKDDIVRGFVEEAIRCLEVSALRAAIVFLWSGAVRELWSRAGAMGWQQVTAAVQKHDPRAKVLTKIEDFAAVKDATFLLAARELALLDKSEWTVLQQDLDLRNQCGHPTRFAPGSKRASAFVEDVLTIVFDA